MMRMLFLLLYFLCIFGCTPYDFAEESYDSSAIGPFKDIVTSYSIDDNTKSYAGVSTHLSSPSESIVSNIKSESLVEHLYSNEDLDVINLTLNNYQEYEIISEFRTDFPRYFTHSGPPETPSFIKKFPNIAINNSLGESYTPKAINVRGILPSPDSKLIAVRFAYIGDIEDPNYVSLANVPDFQSDLYIYEISTAEWYQINCNKNVQSISWANSDTLFYSYANEEKSLTYIRSYSFSEQYESSICELTDYFLQEGTYTDYLGFHHKNGENYLVFDSTLRAFSLCYEYSQSESFLLTPNSIYLFDNIGASGIIDLSLLRRYQIEPESFDVYKIRVEYEWLKKSFVIDGE